MSAVFNPTGALNVSTDSTDLPEQQVSATSTLSSALRRCKNMRLTEPGKARTRDGSAKINSTAIAANIWWIEVMAGVRYAFAGQNIYEDESSIATGLANAQWSAVQYNAFNDTTKTIFALNGTDRKRITSGAVNEWGIAAPTTAPTLGIGGGAGLTGEYNAVYTYVRKVGSAVVAESDPSPAASQNVVLSDNSLSVTVTQPTDSQVTHIRLYRTLAGGAIYYYDQEVAVNITYGSGYTYAWEDSLGYTTATSYKFTTTDGNFEVVFSWEKTYTDRTDTVTDGVYTVPLDNLDSIQADSALGTEVETDNDRPPTGEYVFGPAYDGTLFIIKDNLLYYCKPKQPESWPALYFIEVSVPQFPGVTGLLHNGQPYFLTANEIYYIQGTGDGVFLPIPMRAKTGTQGPQAAESVAGRGIYHVGLDGIYLFSNGSDTKITEENLEPIFRGEDVEGLPGISDLSNSVLFSYKNHLYFAYTSGTNACPTNVLVLNTQTDRLSYYVYNDGSDICVRTMAVDLTNKRILIGDNTGFVRQIETGTDDSGTAISWEVQSKDFVNPLRRHFPRWVKYDIDVTSGSTCTGTLLLDGASHQTHSVTGSRNTRRRLVTTGNGYRAALRISGSGPATVHQAEFE